MYIELPNSSPLIGTYANTCSSSHLLDFQGSEQKALKLYQLSPKLQLQNSDFNWEFYLIHTRAKSRHQREFLNHLLQYFMELLLIHLPIAQAIPMETETVDHLGLISQPYAFFKSKTSNQASNL